VATNVLRHTTVWLQRCDNARDVATDRVMCRARVGERRAQSQCRCCGVSPLAVQRLRGEPGRSADVARGEPSPRAEVAG
jgi:hypothetical protein